MPGTAIVHPPPHGRPRTQPPLLWQPDLVEVPVLRKNSPSASQKMSVPPPYGSALDVDVTDAASASSLEVASLRLPPVNDKMRRRGSDISRVRPPVPSHGSPAMHHDAIELTPMGPSERTGEKYVYSLDEESPVQPAPGVEVETRVPVTVSVQPAEDTDLIAPVQTLSGEQRAQQKRNAMIQFAAICYCFFLEGWNDGSTGPMLPTIQKHYNIGFAVVSLLFVCNTVGFISGSVANVYLTDRYGFGKIVVLGSLLQLVAYVLISPGGPFPLMCIAFVFSGFGLSLQNAQGNGYVGALRDNASTMIGFLHASYGLGAFAAPLVATYFAAQKHWYFHYLISAAIGVTNVGFLAWAYKFKTQDQLMAEAGQATTGAESGGGSKYRQIMATSAVHYLACWALIYVGVEVTLGGWIVTFIEQKRGGGATAGYISSGFFGGLMLGRIVLMWLNRKIGERRVMFIYAFLAIQLEVTVWVVPSLLENALAVSFVGLLLGPMYPILIKQSRDILPRWILTGAMGWIGGIGQAGSAILPFLTGLLASKFGIESLQPFVVSMMSTMVVIWAFVPRVRRID